jgi:hypothetical protein
MSTWKGSPRRFVMKDEIEARDDAWQLWLMELDKYGLL